MNKLGLPENDHVKRVVVVVAEDTDLANNGHESCCQIYLRTLNVGILCSSGLRLLYTIVVY